MHYCLSTCAAVSSHCRSRKPLATAVLTSPQRLTAPLGMRLVVVDKYGIHCRRDTLWHRHLSHPSRPHLAASPGAGAPALVARLARVIITEKPSMGRAVAAALGATTRRTGYLEGASDLVTWCVGHLVELDAPEAYNPAWKQWRLADRSAQRHLSSRRGNPRPVQRHHTAPRACRRDHSRQRSRRRAGRVS